MKVRLQESTRVPGVQFTDKPFTKTQITTTKYQCLCLISRSHCNITKPLHGKINEPYILIMHGAAKTSIDGLSFQLEPFFIIIIIHYYRVLGKTQWYLEPDCPHCQWQYIHLLQTLGNSLWIHVKYFPYCWILVDYKKCTQKDPFSSRRLGTTTSHTNG